jgi:hypothetical protein
MISVFMHVISVNMLNVISFDMHAMIVVMHIISVAMHGYRVDMRMIGFKGNM